MSKQSVQKSKIKNQLFMLILLFSINLIPLFCFVFSFLFNWFSLLLLLLLFWFDNTNNLSSIQSRGFHKGIFIFLQNKSFNLQKESINLQNYKMQFCKSQNSKFNLPKGVNFLFAIIFIIKLGVGKRKRYTNKTTLRLSSMQMLFFCAKYNTKKQQNAKFEFILQLIMSFDMLK